MAKGRELKGRIKSVEGTRKITRTMEMVATSKLKRAQDRVVGARPYAEALTGVMVLGMAIVVVGVLTVELGSHAATRDQRHRASR